MAVIKINNIRTYSFIGCMDEEKKIGSEYRTNIEITFMCRFNKLNDNLKETVDYVAVSNVVNDEMKKTCNLLETAVYKIGNKLLKIDGKIRSVIVEIKKINPPIVGNALFVSVKDEFKR
jgi:dihydroneopterin aldolase